MIPMPVARLCLCIVPAMRAWFRPSATDTGRARMAGRKSISQTTTAQNPASQPMSASLYHRTRSGSRYMCSYPGRRSIFGAHSWLDFVVRHRGAAFAFSSRAVSVTPLNQNDAAFHFGDHASLEAGERVDYAAVFVCQPQIAVCGFMFFHICMSLIAMPNKSPEPTAVGACRSAIAVHVAGRRWLSFHR